MKVATNPRAGKPRTQIHHLNSSAALRRIAVAAVAADAGLGLLESHTIDRLVADARRLPRGARGNAPAVARLLSALEPVARGLDVGAEEQAEAVRLARAILLASDPVTVLDEKPAPTLRACVPHRGAHITRPRSRATRSRPASTSPPQGEEPPHPRRWITVLRPDRPPVLAPRLDSSAPLLAVEIDGRLVPRVPGDRWVEFDARVAERPQRSAGRVGVLRAGGTEIVVERDPVALATAIRSLRGRRAA